MRCVVARPRDVANCQLQPQFPVLGRQRWHPGRSSPAVAHHGFLHTCMLAVTNTYWNEYHFPVCLFSFGPTSTRLFPPHSCPSLDIPSFWENPWDGCFRVKIPADQQFGKHSGQPVWHRHPCHVQSHSYALFFPPPFPPGTPSELQQVIFTSPCLRAFSCCRAIGWFDILVKREIKTNWRKR